MQTILLGVHGIGSGVQQLQTCAKLCQIIIRLCLPKLRPPQQEVPGATATIH